MKLLHFSDVHLLPKREHYRPAEMLNAKRPLAWINLRLRRWSRFTAAGEILAKLRIFLAQSPVDAVVFTGDACALGMDGELRAARERFESFRTSAPVVIVMPGNHDLYLGANGLAQPFYRHFSDLLISDEPGLGGENGFPLVRQVGRDSTIVAVNSAKPNPALWRSSGRIPDRQLDLLGRLLKSASFRGKFKFVATHYPPSGSSRFGLHDLENTDELSRVLAGSEKTVYLCGHVHRPFSRMPPAEDVPTFCAGSLTAFARGHGWLFETGAGLRAAPLRLVDGVFQAGDWASVPLLG